MLDAFSILDEVRQKRQQNQPEQQHRSCHRPVHPLIKVHQPRQFLLVVPGGWLVHTEHHGRADTQLREVKDTEHIGKQTVDAQICRRKAADKNHSADKGQQHRQKLPADVDQHIDDRIACSHAFFLFLLSP